MPVQKNNTPNIVITSISDDSSSVSSLETTDWADEKSNEITTAVTTRNTTVSCSNRNNRVSTEEMIAAATMSAPPQGQINIESSTDINIGSKTIFQGPVIISTMFSSSNSIKKILEDTNSDKTKDESTEIVINSTTKTETIFNSSNNVPPEELKSKTTISRLKHLINTKKQQFIILSALLITLLCMCVAFTVIALNSTSDNGIYTTFKPTTLATTSSSEQ